MDWGSGFQLTRLLFQRGLALVYLIAFAGALNQFPALLGERGLLPAPEFIRRAPFQACPSLFYLAPADAAFKGAAILGIVLSLLALLGLSESRGAALSFGVWAGLWVLYLSFVNVGQIFYGFGWESILLEAGFYAAFLGPASAAAPKTVIWLLRWLLFRVMFGAGLIKLRGDPCWKELTCLDWHFQTQPMPNPLSWYFHHSPAWVRRAGVAFNHLAELAAPLFYFAPARLCAAAGAVTILFQGFIMLSGNLSWLNLLTIVLAIPCFDDRALSLLPLRATAAAAAPAALTYAVRALAGLVAILSVNPIRNLLSPGQVMNTSYNPLHLVGTYGAFGSVTKERFEIVLEGTADKVLTPATVWREYELKGKPGDPGRRPAQIAPYHLRLDWLMWFAAFSPTYDPYRHYWFERLIERLLDGDAATLSLLGQNPFPDAPPAFVRARLYEYRFTTPAERKATGDWWRRELSGEYFPPARKSAP
jgi:hypothetical protein